MNTHLPDGYAEGIERTYGTECKDRFKKLLADAAEGTSLDSIRDAAIAATYNEQIQGGQSISRLKIGVTPA